jgi:hypothetical protein
MAELERCELEIAECTAYLMAGGPDEIGAYVGLTDWQEEKRLILQERSRTKEREGDLKCKPSRKPRRRPGRQLR